MQLNWQFRSMSISSWRLYAANSIVSTLRLCIKPGIQERRTECGERVEWRECFIRRMSPNIPGNVLKHSGECCQTICRMSSNIRGNVVKHSGECPQTFWGMLPNILENVVKHSGECRQSFRGTFFKHSSCSE